MAIILLACVIGGYAISRPIIRALHGFNIL
jgi:hypothetical protein